MQIYGDEPWAAIAPPVMLWLNCIKPWFRLMAFAGTVYWKVRTWPCAVCRATHLLVVETLEEGCDPDETNLIIPHHQPGRVIASDDRNFLIFITRSALESECILERWIDINAMCGKLLSFSE